MTPAARLAAATGVALAALACLPAAAQAPAYPSRPVRWIVPFPPGAANDAMGRLAAQQLQERLGATVVVENRPGGSALIGTSAVHNAAPDGYTLLSFSTGQLLEDNAPLAWYRLRAHELLELHPRGALAPLPRAAAPEAYAEPFFEARATAVPLVPATPDGPMRWPERWLTIRRGTLILAPERTVRLPIIFFGYLYTC